MADQRHVRRHRPRRAHPGHVPTEQRRANFRRAVDRDAQPARRVVAHPGHRHHRCRRRACRAAAVRPRRHRSARRACGGRRTSGPARRTPRRRRCRGRPRPERPGPGRRRHGARTRAATRRGGVRDRVAARPDAGQLGRHQPAGGQPVAVGRVESRSARPALQRGHVKREPPLVGRAAHTHREAGQRTNPPRHVVHRTVTLDVGERTPPRVHLVGAAPTAGGPASTPADRPLAASMGNLEASDTTEGSATPAAVTPANGARSAASTASDLPVTAARRCTSSRTPSWRRTTARTSASGSAARSGRAVATRAA